MSVTPDFLVMATVARTLMNAQTILLFVKMASVSTTQVMIKYYEDDVHTQDDLTNGKISGSFRCECSMGYMHPSPSNEHECSDINECEMFENLCVFGQCENKRGGFRCICDRGYVLDNSGGNCTGKFFLAGNQLYEL